MLASRLKTRLTQSLLIAVSVVALFAATACNFKVDKTDGDSAGGPNRLGQQSAVGFDQINAAIITPKCLGCHTTKKPLLTSYEAVVAVANPIWNEVLVKHTMPKKAVLAENLQDMLRSWCEAGMPYEGSTRDPDPTTVGGIPRPYTFANLQTDVFEQKCNTCHATGNHDGITPLDTYASTMSVIDWMKPLVFGVNGKDPVPAEYLMPPAGSMPMTDQDKALLLIWFADGLRDPYGTPAPVASPSPVPSPVPSSIPSPTPSASVTP